MDAMTVLMPPDSLVKLDQVLISFCNHKWPLWTVKECQCLMGHINWALNIAPSLCPGLLSLYTRMYCPVLVQATKPRRVADLRVCITEEVRRDLRWLQQHFRESTVSIVSC